MRHNTENTNKNQKQSSQKKDQEMRIININGIQPKKYTRNYIRTAKYNWFTFLPLSIFYQFNNYFNCFFLFTAVLTSITIISPLDPATAIGPFLFVLIISLIREAIEDIKKTNYDKMANNSISQLFSITDEKFIEKKWSDLHVGKIIKVKKNEMIPADILIIKSSEDNGICYLETTNLDGESALKPRQALIIYHKNIKEEKNLVNINDMIEVDVPNNHIYKVEGSIYFKKEVIEKQFFSIDNVLLRGGRLKNVDYVYGVVIYTGRDTKIMQNIKKEGRPKQSTIEKKLNTIIIYVLLIVIFLCIISTIFGVYFRKELLPDYDKNLRNGEYIYYYDVSTASDSGNDILEIIRISAGLFIIFNTLIPISLMIASEIIKSIQVQLIERDKEMQQDPDDKLKILSMKLHEDLGMVRYIFSDKTGTLTKNEMNFRACSIFGKSFGDTDEDGEKNQEEIAINNNNIKNSNHNDNIILNNFNSLQKFNSIGKTNCNLNNINRNNNNNSNTNAKKSIFSNTFNIESLRNSILEGGIMNIKDITESPIQTLGEACQEFFFNISLNHNVLVELEEEQEANMDAIKDITDLAKSKKNEITKNLKDKNILNNEINSNNKNTNLTNLIYSKNNNNEIIEKTNLNKDNLNNLDVDSISYQGSNPDEVVLVTAAAEIGIRFLNKDNDTLIVNYFEQLKKFKILQKFEFSSERKRSSIIVEDEQGKIRIYVKGSDEKILHSTSINEFSKKFLLKETKEQLDSFARIGLRTLCFGYKYIEKESYKKWEEIFNKKKQECIIDKSKNSELELIISKIEEDLILLGVTALEDKLQDNVKNDLQEFIEAGISVWMITGDKLDTAESIGHSCKLFNDDTEVFKIKSFEKKDDTKKCLQDIKKKFDLMKVDCEDLNSIGKQIHERNSVSATKSSQNGKTTKKVNTKILNTKIQEINKKEAILERPCSIMDDNTKNKSDNKFFLEINQIKDTSPNNFYNESDDKIKNLDGEKFKNKNNYDNTLIRNTEDIGGESQYNLDKYLTNNKGLSFNENPENIRKSIIINELDYNDIDTNKNSNTQQYKIFDFLKLNNPYKLQTNNTLDNNQENENKSFQNDFNLNISNNENVNNINTIREFSIENNNLNQKNNLNLNTTKQEFNNDNKNINYNQNHPKSKMNIFEQIISDPDNPNNNDKDINIHLPVDQENDLSSTVRILNNEKNSIPFSFSNLNLNLAKSISTRTEKEMEINNINNENYKNINIYNKDKYNFDNLHNVVENKNNKLITQEAFVVTPNEEFGNDKNAIKIKNLFKAETSNFIDKNPFINSFKKANLDNNITVDKDRQFDNFNLNVNYDKNKASDEYKYFLERFEKEQLNKKLKSNAHLLQIHEKLNFNDNLKTEKDFEHKLDLISSNQDASLNKSYSKNEAFKSNLSSDEGDEFYDAKRIDYDKGLNTLNKNSNNNHNKRRRSNLKNRKKIKNYQDGNSNIKKNNKNKVKENKRKSSYNPTNIKRRLSMTPSISLIDRNNLLEMLSKKLVDKINVDNYQNNNSTENNITQNNNKNSNEQGKTPLPNETEDANLDISDRSIIEYLIKNHILDDSQGQIYNPTFLGYYINRQNLNDTNNKILLNSNNENDSNNIIAGSKKDSKNKNKGRLSIDELKILIRENNLSNSNKLKKGVYSISPNKQEDISNNEANKINKDMSIIISNNLEVNQSRNNFDYSGNDNIINFSNSKKIEFGINDGDEMSFKFKDLNGFKDEDRKSKDKNNNQLNTFIGSVFVNSNKDENKNLEPNKKKKKNYQNDNKENNNYYDINNNYVDPSKFITLKPQKNKMLDFENVIQNTKEDQNNFEAPDAKNSKSTNSLTKDQKQIGTEEKEALKESDEKRFLTKETDKKANKPKNKNEQKIATSTKKSNLKNINIIQNTNLNALSIRDPTTDLLKSSLEKGEKINLNQIMEYLENLIFENEKNKKKTLLNFIDFKKNNGAEDLSESIQFKVMNLGVVIEGDSISHCLDQDLKDLFWNIVKNSKSVVCCRCSPKQKAEVVGFVKKKSNEVTLAIGDGGNDIPMIKIANIGVGIFGKEGYQAAFNSDYAISQFKYLKRLIFVHGRNSLLRNSYFIYFFFFKNVLFTLSQLWFCFFSGFSGQNFYDSWYYLGFNSFLTSFPIAARTIMEEDIDLNWVYTNQKDKKINLIPDIYQECRDSVPFHILKFFFVFITALIYSMIVYFIPLIIFHYNFQDLSGRPFTFYDYSLSCYLAIIIIHFFFLFEDTYYYNWFILFAYCLQIGVLILFIFLHESLNSGEVSGITHDILWNCNFWAVTILGSSITCILFLALRRFDFLFSDSIINSIMQNKFESNFTQKLYKKKLEEIRKFHRSIAKFKKIFKMKNQDLDNLSDKRFKDIVDAYKRNHPVDKKSTAKENDNDNDNNIQLPILKRAKSQCSDDLNLKEKTTNIYNKITNNGISQSKKETEKRKIQFENDVFKEKENNFHDDNDNKNNNANDSDDLVDNEKDNNIAVKKYQTFNKNNIHLFDFNSHPSKFFNQN